MSTSQGFSLTEVLISLFLITSTSVGLLTEQWRITQLFNQAILSANALIELDNNAERLLARTEFKKVSVPFNFKVRQSLATVSLSISWPLVGESKPAIASLEQQVVFRK